MRTLIVTAANEAYLPLLQGLVLSLQQWSPLPYTALACFDIDLAPSSRQWISAHAQHVVTPGWDLDVAEELRLQQPHLRALTVRPFLPDYFPGYDIYLWLDADTWVQERQALDWIREGASSGALVAVPEVDRSYRQRAAVQEWRRDRLQRCFGEEAGQRLTWETYFNAGVFALRADAPHWKLWAHYFEKGLAATGGRLCCDQTALNHMLWAEQLSVYPLPARCNWLCHLAPPLFDVVQKKFCEPFVPGHPLGILHLAADTKNRCVPGRANGLRFDPCDTEATDPQQNPSWKPSVPGAEPRAAVAATRKVFIAWELGGGLGHIMQAAALAHGFVAQGCEVFVALRELGLSGLASWPAGCHLLQAPLADQTKTLDNLCNYADILFACGYHDAASLKSLVIAWSNLFDLIDPALVVSDHAPTASLVAKLAEVPLVRIGNGFFAPPAQTPFPVFRHHPAPNLERNRWVDAQVLGAINLVAGSCGHQFDTIAQALQPDLDLITAWPELDHYADQRRPGSAHFLGHPRITAPGASVQWPEQGRVRVLAYLKANYSGFGAVIAALQQADVATVAYVLGQPAAPIPASSSNNFLLRNELFDPWPAAQASDVVLCHASSGVTAAALAAGKPVLMLPYIMEQDLCAQRIEAIGAGLRLEEATVKLNFASDLQRFLSNPAYTENAQALLARNQQYLNGSIERSVSMALACLAGKEAAP